MEKTSPKVWLGVPATGMLIYSEAGGFCCQMFIITVNQVLVRFWTCR